MKAIVNRDGGDALHVRVHWGFPATFLRYTDGAYTVTYDLVGPIRARPLDVMPHGTDRCDVIPPHGAVT